MTKYLEPDLPPVNPAGTEAHLLVEDVSAQSGLSNAPRPSTINQNVVLAAKGGGITFIGRLFFYGSQFVMGILLARLLGAEQLGLYKLALLPATIAAGFAFIGLTQAMVRYVSMFNNRQDMARLWGTLQVGLGFTTILGLLAGIGLYALANPIAEHLFHEPRLLPLLRLSSLMVPFLALSNVLAAATQGFKKMHFTVIAQQISVPLIKLTLIVLLAIIVGLNTTNVLTVQISAIIITFAMLLYFLNSLFPLKQSIRTGQRNTREVLGFSLPIYLSRLIRMLGGQLQTVLLGMFNTITGVAIFSVIVQVSKIGEFFHDSVITASSPIFSELYDRDEWQQMSRFYQTMTKWTLALNLPLFLIVLLFPEPILTIFGQDFVGGATALSILAWGNLINAGTGICGVVINMTGKTVLKLVNSVVIVVLTISLNLLLIPRWGLIGAATAALVATALLNLLKLLEVFILFRLLPYNISFVKPIVAGLTAIVAVLAIRQWWPPIETNLIYLAINIFILLLTYVGLILLLGLSQEDHLVLARLRRRLNIMLSRS